jgi:hypothetical protein
MHLNRKIARRPVGIEEEKEVDSVMDQVLGARGLYEDWRVNKTPEELGLKPQDAQFILGRMSKYHVIEQALRCIALEQYEDARTSLEKVHKDLGEAIKHLKG